MFSEEIIRNSVAFSTTIVVFGLMVWLFFNDRGEWYDPLHGI